MCNPLLAALLGLATGCAAPPAPAGLLAPADPALAARWSPPPPPSAGVKRYAPVEARRDWGAPASPPPPPGPARTMPGMPGMDAR